MALTNEKLNEIRNQKMSYLTLDGCNLTDADITRLAVVLRDHRHITHVSLRKNQLKDPSAKLLSELPLLGVYLTGNHLSTKGWNYFLNSKTIIDLPIRGGDVHTLKKLRDHLAANHRNIERTAVTPPARTLDAQKIDAGNFNHVLDLSATPKTLSADQLKARVRKAGGRGSKDDQEFTTNWTAALKMRHRHRLFDDKKPRKPQVITQVESVADRVREHAARRVDYAFYTAIAYYRSGLRITIADTSNQFGRGYQTDHKQAKAKISKSTLWTEGAHSPLVSTFVDSTVETGGVLQQSLLSRTHFHKTLNGVVEVPNVVNDLDGVLEGKIASPSKHRKQYLALLNEVSQGVKTPIEFLQSFLMSMKSFFIEVKKSNFVREDKIHSPQKARALAIQYEEEGTFQNIYIESKDEDGKPYHWLNDDYIVMLLKLTPSEYYKKQHDPKAFAELMNSAYQKIQREIFSVAQPVEDESTEEAPNARKALNFSA